MRYACPRERANSPWMLIAFGVVMFAALCSPHALRAEPVTFDVAQAASQIGVVLPGRESGELNVGVAVTGWAQDPAKLAQFGLKGFHLGARVVILRIAADRVLVEVDEMSPSPVRASVKLRITSDGQLVAP